LLETHFSKFKLWKRKLARAGKLALALLESSS